ncbi:hypothetical protein [Cellulomonas denverensis]|uniref:hypothetical protein n=1 Tax=Cellulomonas denverensis TaxID=264297 RepID=UPI0035E6A119
MATIRTRERKRPREGQSATAHQVLFRVEGKQTSETFDDRRAAERFARLIDDIGPAEALEVLAEWDQVDTVERAQTVAAWASEHVEGMSGVGAGYTGTSAGPTSATTSRRSPNCRCEPSPRSGCPAG